ncbi:hypothetical protein AgCh_016913 [Apium graveolens]
MAKNSNEHGPPGNFTTPEESAMLKKWRAERIAKDKEKSKETEEAEQEKARKREADALKLKAIKLQRE